LASYNQNVDIDKMYGTVSKSSVSDLLSSFSSNPNGLTSDMASSFLHKYGFNQLKEGKEKKWYFYFFSSLFSPFNRILLGIAAVLIYTDIVLASHPNYSNIVVILILVLTSTLLEFFQEFRSNQAASKLRSLVATTATVLRDAKKEKIPIPRITLGDIVLLSAGDMIPADLRVIESKDLHVSQSSLTGESDAIKKVVNLEEPLASDYSLSDLNTICFMGTNVISGSAKALVIKLAPDTYFGKVAHTLETGKPKTDFEKGIQNISKLLIRFMLVMIPITFFLNAWKHNILTAFTFAVAIAIGITPLLLPVILSSSLAKGAIRMSKKKTIVKKLDSIQNFGAMNILCTDKTGTLTEDKIVLEKYLNVQGEEDFSVLEQAFLNSYFQTGLKGNIDEAIIHKAEEKQVAFLKDNYLKIDEIPFDFSRRRLSVIVSSKETNQKVLITKGAVEEILGICNTAKFQGEIVCFTDELKSKIRSISKTLNKQGMRVVAVCEKRELQKDENFEIKDENEMTLIGFIGFLDPPKESAKVAIEKLNDYGIRVMILTGDNLEVTKAICDKVNVNTSSIVLGSQVDRLNDLALSRLLQKVNVFAKLSPVQKARIIRVLKESRKCSWLYG